MPAQLVSTIKTSYTHFEIIKGFVESWKKQFGTIPSKKSIAVLWSQHTLETGSATSMWNNNVGNVKYLPSKNPVDDNHIQYMMLKNVWEIINGKKVIYQPPHKATWFRSFPNLIEGMSFHLDLLKNKRYKKSWTAVETGSPIDFAHLLKLSNYYTAPEKDYAKALSLYFNKFMKDDTFEKVVASLVVPPPIVVIDDTSPSTTSTQIPDVIPKSIWQKIIEFISTIFNFT